MVAYNLITTKRQLREVANAYAMVDAFAYDVETIGETRGTPVLNRVCWIILATNGRVDVIPMGHPNGEYLRTEYPLLKRGLDKVAKGLEDRLTPADYSRDERRATRIFGPPPEQLDPATVFQALEAAMMGPALKVGHNLPFDLQSVAKYYGGHIPAPKYFDTMWAASILDSRDQIRLGLDDCLMREFRHKMTKGVGNNIALHSFDEVADYGANDGFYTWKLFLRYRKRLIEEKGTRPFSLDMKILPITCNMELTGIPIDVEALKALKDELEDEIEIAKGDVFAAAGKAFALNSNQVKQQLLYGKKSEGGRALRPRKLTPAGKTLFKQGGKPELKHWSVDAEALEHYRGVDDLATALLNYADLNKLMTTYVIPYLGGEVERTTAGKTKKVTKDSLLIKGRIHTRFAPITETGRFSSRNPNLQNVPNPRSANGKKIRNLFVAGLPDWCEVVADYSQIEPRVMASFCGDKRLVNNYLTGGDIYTTMADPFGLDRSAGKVLMLALSYGVGPDKMAASIGITVQQAKDLLKDFEEEFAQIYKYKSQVVKQARMRKPVPFVETLMGRRRYLPDIRLMEPENYGLRSRAERQAFNTVIQGSAADIIKMAMVRAAALIPEQARMVLTVHDELVTLTPKKYADDTAEAIRQAMEGVDVLSVPLVADVKIVEKWGDAK